MAYSPEFPNTLEDVPVGAFFEMVSYAGRYQRVQLPEAYQLGQNRRQLSPRDFQQDVSKLITVTKDGDGHHLPILGTDGRVFMMSKMKPVRIERSPS
jgi:hypothetical protein